MAPAGTLQSLHHEASCMTVCMKTHSSVCITQEMCFGSCRLPATFRASQASSQPALLFVSPHCFSSPLSYSGAHSDILQGVCVTGRGNTIILSVILTPTHSQLLCVSVIPEQGTAGRGLHSWRGLKHRRRCWMGLCSYFSWTEGWAGGDAVLSFSRLASINSVFEGGFVDVYIHLTVY